MKPLTKVSLLRELQAILTVYLCTLLSGYSMGFSAIAIPDIKNKMRYDKKDDTIYTVIVSTDTKTFADMSH